MLRKLFVFDPAGIMQIAWYILFLRRRIVVPKNARHV